jgi:hypothetical protein
MGLESATYVGDLVLTNPQGADQRSEGDDHLRLVKSVLQNTFPGFMGRLSRAQSKSGAYTAVLNDNQTLLFFTAAATLNLTAIATLGNGWAVWVYAGNGDVTVDPNASEEINGAVTLVIPHGQMGFIMSTGIAGDEFVCLIAAGSAPLVPTGVTWAYAGSVAPVGFVLASGRTIGNGSSGATERANADTWKLFELLWTSMGNAEAPVSSGRGANAAADYAANKTIVIPDLRGRAIFGKDDMGGSSANRLNSVLSSTTLGAAGGGQSPQITTSHLPASGLSIPSLGVNGTAADHAHIQRAVSGQNDPNPINLELSGGVGGQPRKELIYDANGNGNNAGNLTTTNSGALGLSASTNSGTTGNMGSGNAFTHADPGFILNIIVKL